jgi:hypothetical protein
MKTLKPKGRKPYMLVFTETQQILIAILKDGMPHHRTELRNAIDGELTSFTNLQNHLSHIRKKLRPIGQDIICEFVNRRICYRHVRLLASACDGRS